MRLAPKWKRTMKWSFPCFLYKGMFCSMAAFKEHCAFGFWKGSLIVDKNGERSREGDGPVRADHQAFGPAAQEGPDRYIKQAKKLNDDGVKAPTRVKTKTPRELVVPDDLAKALKRNKAAQADFDKFSPSNKREYVDWITEAKTEATRSRRLETAIEWMAEGKTRNWKYMNC